MRRVILLDLTGDGVDGPELDSWTLDCTRDLMEARVMLAQKHYPVGLVSFGRFSDEEWLVFNDFLCDTYDTCWIALVQSRLLEDHNFSRLICEHFYDYYTLPLPSEDCFLTATLGHAYGISLLRKLQEDQLAQLDECQMVGASPAMLMLFKQIRKAASVDASVLITGQSGTGKELVAKAVHQRSARQQGPFIPVNCGALPDTLIQAELFGHEKGAFTGAFKRKIGRMEAAEGGSIFLDEIGDLPLDLQVNLLRFLQEKSIERLGSSETIPVDVRVIAATNVDLEEAIAKGTFREDLYYRLNVLCLHAPPLCERGGDIELLARFFFQKLRAELNVPLRGFTQTAVNAMNQHSWPGNVRELINRIRQAMVMSDNRLITPEDLGLDGTAQPLQIPTLSQARALAERDVIEKSLSCTQHNVTQAAKLLKVSRVTLYNLMDKHHLH